MDSLAAAFNFLREWDHVIIGLLAAAGATVSMTYLMRRVDDSARGSIAWPAIGAATLFVTMLLALRPWESNASGAPLVQDGRSAPYLLALLLLLFAGISWLMQAFTDPGEERHAPTPKHQRPAGGDRRPIGRDSSFVATLSAAATSPALVLLAVCVVLVVTLWIIESALGAGSLFLRDEPEFIPVVVAAGLLAMAIIQAVRNLLPVRGAFHRAVLERWIIVSASTPTGGVQPVAASASTPTDGEQPAGTEATVPGGSAESPVQARPTETRDPKALLAALTALSGASSGTERYAVLDMPIEQLCGQIGAGADRLLDNPYGFPSLSSEPQGPSAAVPGAKERSANPDTAAATTPQENATAPQENATTPQKKPGTTVHAMLATLAGGNTDVNKFLNLATQLHEEKGFAAENDRDRGEYMRLRANLSQRIQGNIDRLQIVATFWWRRLLRGLAFVISAVIGIQILREPLPALMCGVVGMFVATLSRDLVAIVEKVRR